MPSSRLRGSRRYLEAARESISIMNCQRNNCSDLGNHTVTVTNPDGVTAVWEVCFEHARSVKVEATRARPIQPLPSQGAGVTVTVECGDCGIPLDESSSLSEGDQVPCPLCGSVRRHHLVAIHETLGFSEMLNATARRPGQGMTTEVRTGGSFTHDLRGWGRIERVIDREHGLYCETITLWDETVIETRSKLTAHRPS
jgi:DNA-directed RNA polymerase subunit RPC12/RpoP